MAEFRMSVDLRRVSFEASQVIDARVLPLLNQAVRAIASQTAANWNEAVQRAHLWSGEKDAYAGSITWKMTGDFEAEVSTDYRLAEEIEEGRPAKDLKRMLDTSMKVRMSAKGKRYLIIPFRHNTPGNQAHAKAMPPAIYAAASGLAPSRIVGQGTRLSGIGAVDMKTRQPVRVAQNKYNWGGKLVGAALMGGSKHHEGMYRFDTTTPGGKRHSSYLTFRVMVEGSKGWIVAPRPGLHIARQVRDDMQPLAEQAIAEATKRSLG